MAADRLLKISVFKCLFVRRKKTALISAVIVVIATILVVSLWLHRCPVQLKVLSAEPSPIIYFGDKQGMEVTFSVSCSDRAGVTYEIPAFEANMEGRWMEWQQVGGLGRLSAGATTERKLVMPEATRCRVRICYARASWRARIKANVGPTGRRWIAKSRWLSKLLAHDQFEAARVPTEWLTNTVEIVVPAGDRSTAR